MLTTCRRYGSRIAGGLALAALLVALFAAAPRAHADELQRQQQRARLLEQQVESLDRSASDAMERYRSNLDRYHDLSTQAARARADVASARRTQRQAQRRLNARAVAVYVGQDNSGLVTLATSGSLPEFLDRVDAAHRVANMDATILAEVRATRLRVARRKQRLDHLRALQRSAVAAADHERRIAAGKLQRRQKLLASAEAGVRRILAQRRAAAAAAAAERSRALAREAARQADVHDQSAADQSAPAFDPVAAISAPPPAAAPVPSGSGAGPAAVAVAMRYLGTPYQWGGSSPSTGFDCSGLVMYSYSQVGVSLPRTTYSMWNAGAHVTRDQLQVGDLVFFANLGHMGMYIGGGNFIHAPHTGDVVKINSLDDSWYASTYMGAVRVG